MVRVSPEAEALTPIWVSIFRIAVTAVAFLACQPLESLNITASVAEGGEDGDNREQVRAVVEVGVEGAERGFLGGDQAAVTLRGIGLRSVFIV